MKNILSISNLNISLNDKKIINNLNLTINNGETHIIMGPNGAGKSTLANILIGNNLDYKITGDIYYEKKNLIEMNIEERSLNGIFLSFQNPIEINGLSNYQFFKTFIDNHRKKNKLEKINNSDFIKEIKKYMEILNIKDEFLYRNVNEGFSGGEKKKNEILQMLLIKPKLIILDEIDSGLDVDAIKDVFKNINLFKNENNAFIIITHYTKILDYTKIDKTHIIKNGKIVKSGDKKIIDYIEKHGYDFK